MPNNHLPTQTAVIKALSRALGDTESVKPAHLISSRPGFYVATGLKHVSGPVIICVSSDREWMAGELAGVLANYGWDIKHSGYKITVNAIPKGFNR